MPPSRSGSPEPAAGRTADPSFIGRCFEGRYRIEAQLGDGGVGRVYRARHLRLDRPVALKVLRKQHNELWVSRQRFEREARALGQLSHPHIVAVTDSGMDADVPFLVMELLEGRDLASLLRGGALPPRLACRYALELLEGLAFVHQHGLVHRDIKPGNVFLERLEPGAERVKLLDFGLARLVIPNNDASVSRYGEMLGTPAYMAPEQITAERVDARSDVYAVGLLLFEMIVGRRPFCGNEPEVLGQHLSAPVPRLVELQPDAVSLARVDDVIQRAVQKNASERFTDARAMATALAAAAAELPAAARSHSPAARAGARSRRPRAGAVSRVIRAVAMLVSCIAALAIVIASGVIYLLDSPRGDERRELLQRVLSSLLEEQRAAPDDSAAPNHSAEPNDGPAPQPRAP
jgi:serine/threonine-protein kinase